MCRFVYLNLSLCCRNHKCVDVNVWMCVSSLCINTLDTRWHVIYKYRKYRLASHRAKASCFFLVFWKRASSRQGSQANPTEKWTKTKSIAKKSAIEVSAGAAEGTVSMHTHTNNWLNLIWTKRVKKTNYYKKLQVNRQILKTFKSGSSAVKCGSFVWDQSSKMCLDLL